MYIAGSFLLYNRMLASEFISQDCEEDFGQICFIEGSSSDDGIPCHSPTQCVSTTAVHTLDYHHDFPPALNTQDCCLINFSAGSAFTKVQRKVSVFCSPGDQSEKENLQIDKDNIPTGSFLVAQKSYILPAPLSVLSNLTSNASASHENFFHPRNNPIGIVKLECGIGMTDSLKTTPLKQPQKEFTVANRGIINGAQPLRRVARIYDFQLHLSAVSHVANTDETQCHKNAILDIPNIHNLQHQKRTVPAGVHVSSKLSQNYDVVKFRNTAILKFMNCPLFGSLAVARSAPHFECSPDTLCFPFPSRKGNNYEINNTNH